jgi:predicted nucleic acid-binding protein
VGTVNAVFDTTVLIDYLNGIPAAATEIDQYDQITISVISWIEVMAGVKTDEEDAIARKFLETFNVHPVDIDVADLAAKLRKSERLRVPDAIIRATARVLGQLLVTRNSKDFPASEPGIRIPYVL